MLQSIRKYDEQTQGIRIKLLIGNWGEKMIINWGVIFINLNAFFWSLHSPLLPDTPQAS